MNERCCACCAFVGHVHNGDPGELICVKCPLALGEPVRVQPQSVCENFLRKPSAYRPTALPTPPNDKIRYIPLTKNQFAIVDAADFHELNKYKWAVTGRAGKYYACRRDSQSGKMVLMHRQIMQPPPGKVTDHINGYRLDNRRENLRNCTNKENSWNRRGQGARSGFKGVGYSAECQKYAAGIRIDGKPVHLGWFDDPVEAARIRDRKALEVCGPYAFINLPDDLEPHPIGPDPSHPGEIVRYTGPCGWLHLSTYWPASPHDKVTFRTIGAIRRCLHSDAWALTHPTLARDTGEKPEPPTNAKEGN